MRMLGSVQRFQITFPKTWASIYCEPRGYVLTAQQLSANFTARNGVVVQANLQYGYQGQTVNLGERLAGSRLHEINDWTPYLGHNHSRAIAEWFAQLFGNQA